MHQNFIQGRLDRLRNQTVTYYMAGSEVMPVISTDKGSNKSVIYLHVYPSSVLVIIVSPSRRRVLARHPGIRSLNQDLRDLKSTTNRLSPFPFSFMK